MASFSGKSQARLNTCHPDLITLANEVIKVHDCTVVFGHRGEAEQNEAYAKGNSKLQFPQSKHNKLPSMAIDLGPYLPNENVLYNREQTLYFAGIVMGIAHKLFEEGKMIHKVRWGGDWDSDNNFKEHSFYDGIHFELV